MKMKTTFQSNRNAVPASSLSPSCSTESVQALIDATSLAGGGVVEIPPGTYSWGTVVLKSRVHLQLAPGCLITPSTNKEDFPLNRFYENTVNPVDHRVLFYAKNATDIRIGGHGIIDGKDKSFWQPWDDSLPRYRKGEWRPMLMAFENCENVRIADLHIQNSPVYSIWPVGCTDLRIDRVCIENDLKGPNADGLHISSCQRVFVSGCDFRAGDDCIAVDSDGEQPSRDVVISDCIFETSTNAVRLYTGLDPWVRTEVMATIERVTISNCSVRDAGGVINIVAKAGAISGVVVNGIVANQDFSGTAVFLQTMRGTIRDVSISDLMVKTNGACALMGDCEGSISGVSLRQCTFRIHPKPKKWALGFPETLTTYTHYHEAPWTLHFRNSENIHLEAIDMIWDGDVAAMPPPFHLESVKNFHTDRVTFQSAAPTSACQGVSSL